MHEGKQFFADLTGYIWKYAAADGVVCLTDVLSQ